MISDMENLGPETSCDRIRSRCAGRFTVSELTSGLGCEWLPVEARRPVESPEGKRRPHGLEISIAVEERDLMLDRHRRDQDVGRRDQSAFSALLHRRARARLGRSEWASDSPLRSSVLGCFVRSRSTCYASQAVTGERRSAMIDLYAELKVLLRTLDVAGIPYALCGGLALMVYQRPRATVDIDLILPAEATGKCIQALKPLGFRAHPRPMRLEASGVEIQRFYKLEEGGPDVLMLDCLLTTHPLVAEAWQGRVRVPFDAGTAWVVSLAGLIVLKRLRGSPLDLVDIEGLEALVDQPPEDSPGSDHGCP